MNCFQTFHFNQLALVVEMPDNYQIALQSTTFIEESVGTST